MKLTEREKKLMIEAAETMFWAMVNRLDIEPPDINPEAEMKAWLESPIEDNGGTAEEYLNWKYKAT